MIQRRLQTGLTLAETFIALPVFVIIMTYTYAYFFQLPSVGFTWLPDGHISTVYAPGVNGDVLQKGDQLVQVGPVVWSDYVKNIRQKVFENAQPGQVVPITFEHQGQTQTINWVMPNYGPGEVDLRVNNNWWISYVFLLVGTLTLVIARPKDTRWRLFVLFNYLTAIWLSAGGMAASTFRVLEGAIVLRVFVWLCVPVYLHFHWVFPKPLASTPQWLWPSLYALSFGLVILQWFQLLPNSLYLVGFMIGILGSAVLLVLHLVRRSEDRRQIWPVIVGSLVGLIPPIVLAGILAEGQQKSTAPLLALFFFPIVPLAYFLAIYRQRLGALELRANRAVAVYLFLSFLGTLVILGMALGEFLNRGPLNSILVGLLAAALGILTGVYLFDPFQKFVERGLFGVHLPPAQLLETSAARIASSLDLPSLTTLIRDEITASLLIRQSALYAWKAGQPSLLYAQAVTLPLTAIELNSLTAQAGHYLTPETAETRPAPLAWVRLCLPIVINQEQLGVWLLGRRDPDDYYSQTDIQMLQTLANQAAVALAHIQQTEQLRLLYENDINQREVERASLARELHDNALNELSYFKRTVEHLENSAELNESYERVTEALRRTITELQPAAVNYGLQLALMDLADRAGQTEKANAPTIAIEVEEETPGTRFDEFVELHLYRVTQQAISNAIQHAQATKIAVRGHIRGDSVEVQVEDDGVGFEANGRSDAARLVQHKHFGLAGMYERAQIIGAQLQIHSKPREGARVHISWQTTKAPI
jgi:signal transduction histidine kinase